MTSTSDCYSRCELGRVGFAEDQRSRSSQGVNHRRIQLWVVILVDGREVLSRHVLGEDDILDAYGDTMKWASLISGSGIELFGGL